MYPCFTDSLREDAEHYFPELLESEDEKIRKAIVLGIKRCADAGSIFGTVINNEGVNYHDVLAWLEKQKEQKPIGDGELNALAYLEQLGYTCIPPSAEKRDYSCLNDLERAIHRGFLAAGVENVHFGIIKETAKECLAQMKTAEWGEEDEKMLKVVQDLIYGIELSAQTEFGYKQAVACLEWLNSIRPQPKQEWSEEDERILKGIIGLVDHDQHYNVSNKEMLDWLKSLRPFWKPSEEQMNALRRAVNKLANTDVADSVRLSIMYDNLKKLM